MFSTKVLVLGVAVKAARGFTPPTSNYVNGACVEEGLTLNGTDVDLFPHKTSSNPAYSLLWDVTYHGTYKVLRHALAPGNPYVLYQCGTTPPDLDYKHTLVSVPVSRAVTTSTTYLPFFEMIEERQSVKAYTSTFDLVTSPCFRKMYRDGDIISAITDTGAIDASQMSDIELTIADNWTMSSVPNGYVMTDTHEDSVLKTAEYVELVGLFFNREQQARIAFEKILWNWNCAKATMVPPEQDSVAKKVLYMSYWGAADGWSIASCPNWYCEIITNAGGQVIEPTMEPDIIYWGYPYLSTAQVLELATDADVLISSGVITDELRQIFIDNVPHLAVYDAGGELGYNDFYERRHVEPDAFLEDVAYALWKLTDHKLKFLRDVIANDPPGEKHDDLDEACPVVTAPYVFESDCYYPSGEKSSSKKSKRPHLAIIVVVAVVLGLLVVGLLAALFMGVFDKKEVKQAREMAKHVEVEIPASANEKATA